MGRCPLRADKQKSATSYLDGTKPVGLWASVAADPSPQDQHAGDSHPRVTSVIADEGFAVSPVPAPCQGVVVLGERREHFCPRAALVTQISGPIGASIYAAALLTGRETQVAVIEYIRWPEGVKHF